MSNELMQEGDRNPAGKYIHYSPVADKIVCIWWKFDKISLFTHFAKNGQPKNNIFYYIGELYE